MSTVAVWLAAWLGWGAARTLTLIDRLIARETVRATEAFDAPVMVDLRPLTNDGNQALEQAIGSCLPQPTSLATASVPSNC